MPTGSIKKLIPDKGFGFIKVEGQNDVFFHTSACGDGVFDTLQEGMNVQFDIEQGQKGPKATNVVVLA